MKMKIDANFPINISSVNEFVRVLLPNETEKDIYAYKEYKEDKIIITVKSEDNSAFIEENNLELFIEDQSLIMFKSCLLKLFKKKYSWGSLMGVRPTKMVRRFFKMGLKKEKIKELLSNMFLVKSYKIQLLLNVIECEERLLNKNATNIYVGIPFCPTKCSYCSFASYEIKSNLGKKFYNPFVETLIDEIKLIGEFSKTTKFKYESIYIGGGTPSILTDNDLIKILKTIWNCIDMSNIKEFTFEAGREDVITCSQLKILKNYGVDRISLNPQTFNEHSLKVLNRQFNRQHFDEIYECAKKLGFIINMDIIIGLPGESVDDILNTLNHLERYDMENLTVHTLARKKGSKIYKNDFINCIEKIEIVEKRIEKLIEKKNMFPYYMYRQKNSFEWGENVGYSVAGYESLFNIEMIEENQQTIGIGGGAISKIIKKDGDYTEQIKRVINPKDPALYIAEMKERHIKKILLFNEG